MQEEEEEEVLVVLRTPAVADRNRIFLNANCC
jgi:hypothetical protein